MRLYFGLLIAFVASEFCFEPTPIFGLSKSYDHSSDLYNFLLSPAYNTSLYVQKFVVCGGRKKMGNQFYMSFEGIQMFLGNPPTEDLIELNIYGKGLGETNCINWFLSEQSWITNITIGGNADVGLTYIQMYTS